jgi:hypothetical protein
VYITEENMTKKLVLWAFVALSVVAAVSPAHAAFIFNFDENGNGSISNAGGPFTKVIGTMTANPSCASLPGGLCLTYLLGTTVGNGDVAISDSAAAFVLGDGIRFTDANGGLTGSTADRLLYFSDIEPGLSDGALADTGFPTNFNSSVVAATETGPEGSNGFTFGSPNVYNGVSDGAAAPEPAAVLLFGSGALVLAMMRRQRRSG